MKKSTTKRALFLSFVSMFLCFTMLLGTTYAWFTDTVTSDVNTIVAGNLDVELYNGLDDTAPAVNDTTVLFDGIKLWEPGAAVYENFTVANKGNLALKYKFDVVIAKADGFESFADVLKVGVVDGGIADNTKREDAIALVKEWMPFASFFEDGTLEANETDKYGVVVYWEPSDKDNDYNMNNGNAGKELKVNIGVNLFATQLTSEYDSFGNDYDATADGKKFVKYGFNDSADLLAFAPTAGDASSSGLSLTSDGKAQIDASGAWYTIDADLTENEYVIDYEIDITNLAIGENVTVDTGETTAWGSTPIMLERGSTKVYYGVSKNEYIGTLEGTVVNVTHTYKYNSDNMLEITTVISDGVDSLTYTKAVASAAKTELYWDIYYATESGKATMDDFSEKTTDCVVDSGAELASAIAAAEDGDTVTFVGNITSKDGITITDKNIIIDLNGYTFTVTEGASTNSRNFKIDGSSVVTIKNGTMVAAGDYSSGAYGTVRTEGSAVVTLTDLKLYNYRGNGLNIKALTGTTVYLSNTEIYSQYGGGIESAGATITVDNVKVEQKGMYTAPYNSMAISVNGGGKVTVNSGTFSTECLAASDAYNQGSSHGPWVIGVLNSGGTLIVNGGTFSNDNYGDNSLATAARGAILADTGANVIVNGGNFNALAAIVDIQNNLGDASKNPVVTLKGGNFSSDPTAKNISNCIVFADGYTAVDNGDGTYTVKFPQESVEDLFENASANSKVEIPAGTYTFPASDVKEGMTIECAPGTVFKGTSSLNVNGATVVGATFSNKGGQAVSGTINGYFKDCVFEGEEALRWCYTTAGETVVFENCVIKTDFRGIHFDEMNGDVKFINCEINGFNAIGGTGSVTFEGCTFGYDKSRYNGLNMYVNTTLTDCEFEYLSGKTNFIDFEAAGKNLTITNCTATLDGEAANVIDFVGGTYVNQTNIVIDGAQVVRSSEALNAAVKTNASIYLMPGEYELTKSAIGATIKGASEETVKVNAKIEIYGFTGKFPVRMHFENVTFTNTISTFQDTATEETGGGASTFTNVTFAAGFRHGYGSKVVFTDCTFGSNSEGYALHFEYDEVGTAGVIKVTGCKFNGGKVHLGGPRTYAFTNCDFATGTDFQVWTGVTLDGCTVNGVKVTDENVATFFPALDLTNVTLK